MSAREALTDMTLQETAESIVAHEAAGHDKQTKTAKEVKANSLPHATFYIQNLFAA